jgi:hypothetical protein
VEAKRRKKRLKEDRHDHPNINGGHIFLPKVDLFLDSDPN